MTHFEASTLWLTVWSGGYLHYCIIINNQSVLYVMMKFVIEQRNLKKTALVQEFSASRNTHLPVNVFR